MPLTSTTSETPQPTRARPTSTDAPPPVPARSPRSGVGRGWRRVVNRRNAMWTAIVAVVAAVALVFIIFMLYRTGQVDRYVARQIISRSPSTTYGPRSARSARGSARARSRSTTSSSTTPRRARPSATSAASSPRCASKTSGALPARNVNLEKLTVDRPEIWVVYDAEGRSNFSGLKIPPPEPNSRILFAYSTADVTVNDAVVHYDDRRYDISGEAKNVRATVKPDDPNAPAESRMNLIDLCGHGLDLHLRTGAPVNPIDIELHARANQTSADISELVLRSPVAEARMTGTLDDWRALRYHMDVRADVDLTQTSDVLQLETTMRGAGRFEGKVEGEGDKYKVEGQIVSDALAADGVRLKALK
jgi:hypothetical protein